MKDGFEIQKMYFLEHKGVLVFNNELRIYTALIISFRYYWIIKLLSTDTHIECKCMALISYSWKFRLSFKREHSLKTTDLKFVRMIYSQYIELYCSQHRSHSFVLLLRTCTHMSCFRCFQSCIVGSWRIGESAYKCLQSTIPSHGASFSISMTFCVLASPVHRSQQSRLLFRHKSTPDWNNN